MAAVGIFCCTVRTCSLAPCAVQHGVTSSKHLFIQRGSSREGTGTCSHLESAPGQPASAGAAGVNGLAPLTSHATRREI